MTSRGAGYRLISLFKQIHHTIAKNTGMTDACPENTGVYNTDEAAVS